jgi:hypothetical protein
VLLAGAPKLLGVLTGGRIIDANAQPQFSSRLNRIDSGKTTLNSLRLLFLKTPIELSEVSVT